MAKKNHGWSYSLVPTILFKFPAWQIHCMMVKVSSFMNQTQYDNFVFVFSSKIAIIPIFFHYKEFLLVAPKRQEYAIFFKISKFQPSVMVVLKWELCMFFYYFTLFLYNSNLYKQFCFIFTRIYVFRLYNGFWFLYNMNEKIQIFGLWI